MPPNVSYTKSAETHKFTYSEPKKRSSLGKIWHNMTNSKPKTLKK